MHLLKMGWSDRNFVKSAYKLIIPGMLQALVIAISSLVISFILGFITVASEAKESVSGVALSLQMFSMCIVCCTGICIVGNFLGGKYIGAGDMKSVQYTTRWKIIMSLCVALVFITIIVSATPEKLWVF